MNLKKLPWIHRTAFFMAGDTEGSDKCGPSRELVELHKKVVEKQGRLVQLPAVGRNPAEVGRIRKRG
ncbi:MAG: hypothetical protein EA344_09555 [Alkalicoccus sp.]|nr:MAG: hypothetical protein EA344_09555 [Alkalicoccus sp.]